MNTLPANAHSTDFLTDDRSGLEEELSTIQSKISLDDMLRNTGGELAILAKNARHLDDVIGDFVTGEKGDTAQHLHHLQKIDQLAQSLRDISVLLSNLSNLVPSDVVVATTQVTKGMRLASTVHACLEGAASAPGTEV